MLDRECAGVTGKGRLEFSPKDYAYNRGFEGEGQRCSSPVGNDLPEHSVKPDDKGKQVKSELGHKNDITTGRTLPWMTANHIS
ncbi:Hypothetical predicted protein [Podarcis lilfordi]|uniref:Uncharacterized protein n=1 Tax=Podarcis lilfordi TaxID=74358 RepID=A0AA35KHS8_9SAUR|nr:Hypothetical predicted protein [Podarcis lilfordi]